MNGWEIVFQGRIEGRSVIIKIYRSGEDGDDEDVGPAIRVLTSPSANHAGDVGAVRGGETLVAGPVDPADPIVVEPETLDDLREELVEIGFSPEAAATIAGKVSD